LIKKNIVRAAEQDRPDIAAERMRWQEDHKQLDPKRLVFIDETWAKANMAPTHGRCRRGQRLYAKVPHGHWKTTTFVAALRHDGITAPFVLDGQEAPNRAIADTDIARGKLAPDVMKRQIGRRGEPVSLIFETRVALLSHRLGRDAPGPPEPLRPLHNTAHGDTEPPCRIPAACARLNSRHHARKRGGSQPD
jgi:hypothetical protein